MSGSSDRDVKPAKVIEVQPDAPALLAKRLADRLEQDGLLGILGLYRRQLIVEALADEIHQDILDCTLRAKGGR